MNSTQELVDTIQFETMIRMKALNIYELYMHLLRIQHQIPCPSTVDSALTVQLVEARLDKC